MKQTEKAIPTSANDLDLVSGVVTSEMIALVITNTIRREINIGASLLDRNRARFWTPMWTYCESWTFPSESPPTSLEIKYVDCARPSTTKRRMGNPKEEKKKEKEKKRHDQSHGSVTSPVISAEDVLPPPANEQDARPALSRDSQTSYSSTR